MATLFAATCASHVAWAAPTGTAAVGPLIKGEVNLAAPGFALQSTSFQRTENGETRDFSFNSPMMVAGPTVAVNFGFAATPRLRWGLRASAQGAAVLFGDMRGCNPEIDASCGTDPDGVPVTGQIPFTQLDAQLRLTIGPTLGIRFAPKSPLELELGLGFATQTMVGSQQSIGSPANGYPLGAIQYGVDGLARVIWRPWGASSVVGFQAGLDLGWAMTTAAQASTHGILVTPEFGIVIGL